VSEQEEARFLLEVARAQWNVRSIEQELSKANLRENAALGELYKFRAELAEQKLDMAEFDLGYIRNLLRQGGHMLDDALSSRKRCCHSSLSSLL